jgi:outer membrane protein insertion porin family
MEHRSHTLAFAWLAVVALAAAASSACHEDGDVRVASVSFEGNRAFRSSQLEDVIVTRATGWLPWARPRYFNRAVFDADLARLKSFYDDRGYPQARVTSSDVAFTDQRDAVRLSIHIDEGAPLIVERVAFTGLDQAPPEVTEALETVPLRAGAPRDRQLVAATRERVSFVLRDSGYPRARVGIEESPGSSPERVVLTIAATPGEAATFGDVEVVGLGSVHESLVRRALAFEPAETYRESLVLESQRRLRRLGIFEFAHVRTDPAAEARPGDRSRVPMVVTISEGRPTRLQLGLGYGSEDGPRGSAGWEHLNFLGDARRFSVDARYSTRLRGGGIEFVEPYFLTPTVSFSARLGSWWTDEPTHTARRRGGRLGLTWSRSSERGVDLEPIDHVVRVGFASESLEFTIDPATLADLMQFENLIALGLDPITGVGSGRLAALELDLERTAVDRPADPQRGHALSLHLKHAAPWLGGLYRYDEAIAEGRVYLPVGDRHVWATRARVGAIAAGASAPVPISERYFLGGSTTLRGWGRFQVAPLTPDGLPVGGRAMLDSSTEWRMTIRGSLGAAVFVDAGNVWSAAEGLGAGRVRVDAGPGIRWASPLGIVRADLGIQLTPIDNLRVNGRPETRRWRIHFSIGHPF